MKTFNQYFNLYKKIYSFEKLFLPQTYSLKESEIFLRLCIIVLILFVLGDSMLIFNYATGSIAYILMFTPSIPILIYVFIIKTIQARKELKNNNLPIPIQWYKWKSNELDDIRITIIYKDYKDISPSILEKLIEITYKYINEPIKNPFLIFEKYVEYAGKLLITLLIGILTYNLYNNLNMDNFGITIRLIIGLLLFIGLLIFIWEYLLKKPYFENQLGEKEKLKEYAFVLENISLMKLQMNNSKKSNN